MHATLHLNTAEHSRSADQLNAREVSILQWSLNNSVESQTDIVNIHVANSLKVRNKNTYKSIKDVTFHQQRSPYSMSLTEKLSTFLLFMTFRPIQGLVWKGRKGEAMLCGTISLNTLIHGNTLGSRRDVDADADIKMCKWILEWVILVARGEFCQEQHLLSLTKLKLQLGITSLLYIINHLA